MMAFVRYIKRCFSPKEYIVVLLTVAISIGSGVGVFYHIKKDVVINDNGKQVVLKTMVKTVEEALRQAGISVETFDYISVPVDSSLSSRAINEINIKRAVPVTIVVDGTEREIMTCAESVRDVLAEASVEINEYDRIEEVTPHSPVEGNMKISIVRVEKEYVSNIEKPLSAPVNEVIEYGTVKNFKDARGDVIRYKEVLDMRATAYTASFKDTGKHPDHPEFGITYTGIKAEVGIIAVDPKVIPLGTRVYVEMPGEEKDYGFALAADTGSAIKGDLIDLYMDTQEEVDRWGCKECRVYILYD